MVFDSFIHSEGLILEKNLVAFVLPNWCCPLSPVLSLRLEKWCEFSSGPLAQVVGLSCNQQCVYQFQASAALVCAAGGTGLGWPVTARGLNSDD